MKKIIISILYIGIFGSCFFFSACKKKKDEPAPATSTPTPTPTTPTPTTPTPTTPIPSIPTSTSSKGSFTLDGITYSDGIVLLQKAGSSFQIAIYAGNYTFPIVTIYLLNVTKTGTVDNVTGNYGFLAYTLNNPETDTYASLFGGSFSYTITNFTSNKIEGTFNLVAKKTGDSKTATGSFNCTY